MNILEKILVVLKELEQKIDNSFNEAFLEISKNENNLRFIHKEVKDV